MTRLDKFLCDNGFGTRKEVKALIKSGRVKIDGTAANAADKKIDPECAKVTVNNTPIRAKKSIYIIMNKPKGTVCAARDKLHKTVFDILPRELFRKDLFTMGRLDIDTTGLVVITNDGELSHRLLSPKRHAEKTYFVEARGKLCENAAELFKEGLTVGDERFKPAELKIISAAQGSVKAYLTLTEGRFHQVKRMFHSAGAEVIALKRISFAGLSLPPDLPEGASRPLTEEEEAVLKSNGF